MSQGHVEKSIRNTEYIVSTNCESYKSKLINKFSPADGLSEYLVQYTQAGHSIFPSFPTPSPEAPFSPAPSPASTGFVWAEDGGGLLTAEGWEGLDVGAGGGGGWA